MTSTELVGELLHLCMSSAGPLIFVLIAALSPLLLVPAALLGAVAGLSFGPLWGVVLTLIGCNLSATLTYSLGRFSVRHQPNLEQAGLLRRYSRALRRRAFLTVVALRLSFLPYDPLNYMIGAAHVPYLRFLAANTLGSLPGVVAIVLAGASVQSLGDGFPTINPILVIAAVVVAVIGLAIAHVLAHRDAGPI
ncbi:MAG: VTT domain-containing protein [Oscillochloris sp.]|nr:VTT domain-containing protein [Oscillochloris sp.]